MSLKDKERHKIVSFQQTADLYRSLHGVTVLPPMSAGLTHSVRNMKLVSPA